MTVKHIDKNFWPAFQPVRFVLAIIIIALHSNWHNIPLGYLSVEMFFSIFGFLLASRVYSLSCSGKFEEQVKRILFKLYAPYVCSLLLSIVIVNQWPFGSDFIAAIFMMQSMGFTVQVINGPSWFVCCYFYSMMFFLFISINFNKNILILFSAISAFAGYAILHTYTPSHGINYSNEVKVGFATVGFIRAFAGIGLGVILFNIYESISDLRMVRWFCTAIETVTFVLIAYIMKWAEVDIKNEFAFIFIASIAILLLALQRGALTCSFAALHKRFPGAGNASFLYIYLPLPSNRTMRKSFWLGSKDKFYFFTDNNPNLFDWFVFTYTINKPPK